MRNFVRNPLATFFFRFWSRFDPLLPILPVLGGAASIRGPDQKDLAKIWNSTEKSPKVKKIDLTIKMCGILPGIPRQLFFFRLWTRFDPLLAILLVLGGTASIGGPDQKDLAKIWNLTEKSPKVKKIELAIKMYANFARNPVTTFFFDFGPVLTHFWPFY